MNVHAKRRIHSAVLAIVFVGLQTLSMAMPANAEVLDEMSKVQTMTTKDVTQKVAERDNYSLAWIVFPVDAGLEVMSSDFGYRKKACGACSTNHAGIDFLMARGSTVRSVFYGTVVSVSQYSGSFGTTVEITHPDLGGIVTLYAHMVRGSTTVNVGDSVVPGQKIGEVGRTGVATANHLHFGVYVDGRPIDPEVWLISYGATRFYG